MKTKIDPCKFDSEAVLLHAGVKFPLWKPKSNWSYIDVIGSHFYPVADVPMFSMMSVVGVNVVGSAEWGTN